MGIIQDSGKFPENPVILKVIIKNNASILNYFLDKSIISEKYYELQYGSIPSDIYLSILKSLTSLEGMDKGEFKLIVSPLHNSLA